MNEFNQTSLKGQGLLLLEQGISRVCSIGESPIELKFFQVLSTTLYIYILKLCVRFILVVYNSVRVVK